MGVARGDEDGGEREEGAEEGEIRSAKVGETCQQSPGPRGGGPGSTAVSGVEGCNVRLIRSILRGRGRKHLEVLGKSVLTYGAAAVLATAALTPPMRKSAAQDTVEHQYGVH
jgi:hypothetical protein